jgi:hypothetical protein
MINSANVWYKNISWNIWSQPMFGTRIYLGTYGHSWDVKFAWEGWKKEYQNRDKACNLVEWQQAIVKHGTRR